MAKRKPRQWFKHGVWWKKIRRIKGCFICRISFLWGLDVMKNFWNRLQMSQKTGLSLRTVKRMTVELQKRGKIHRVRNSRSGKWMV